MKSLLVLGVIFLSFIGISQTQTPQYRVTYDNSTLIMDSDTLYNTKVTISVYNDHYIIKTANIGVRAYYSKSGNDNKNLYYVNDSASLVINNNYFKYNSGKVKIYK